MVFGLVAPSVWFFASREIHVMKALSSISFLVAAVACIFAAYLYWEHEYGACRDGCPEGMIFALFTPAVIVFVLAALFGILLRLLSGRAAK